MDCSGDEVTHFYSREPSRDALPVEVVIESSPDGGSHWVPLHQLCLPGYCPLEVQNLKSTINSNYNGG